MSNYIPGTSLCGSPAGSSRAIKGVVRRRQVIGVLLGLFILCTCPVFATQYSISNVQIDAVGNTATAELRIDAVPPNGTSGYVINLNVADPSVAKIIDVEYPSALKGMTDTTPTPFTSGHISWLDANEKLQAGDSQSNILLATITVKGLSEGSSTRLVPRLKMLTDDKGYEMLPTSTINTPTITIAGSGIPTSTAVTPLSLPGQANPPKDPLGTGMMQDLNGDGTVSSTDVSLYFTNFDWIQNTEPVALFDYNNNGIIDFGDIVILNEKV